MPITREQAAAIDAASKPGDVLIIREAPHDITEWRTIIRDDREEHSGEARKGQHWWDSPATDDGPMDLWVHLEDAHSVYRLGPDAVAALQATTPPHGLPTREQMLTEADAALSRAYVALSDAADWLRSDWTPVGTPLTAKQATRRERMRTAIAKAKKVITEGR